MPLRYSLLFSLAVAMACLASVAAHAGDYPSFGPLVTRVQHPVYLQTIALMPQRAEVIPQGGLELRADSAYSNLFEQGQTAKAVQNLDMEYWRVGFNARYGFARDWEAGLEIPLVHMSGGFLDAFIQDFHNFFHLPNAGRDRVPNNEFHYRFDAGGRTIFDYPPLTAGLGDITLRVKNQVTHPGSGLPTLAWFADFKFPTGQRSRGVSNGAFDFGLGVALEGSWKRLHGYANAGYYVTGGNELLDGYQHLEMLQFAVAGEITLLPDLSLIVQLDGGTPELAGTGIGEWDGVPLDLIVGFRGEEQDLFGEGRDLFWQVGFAEDVTSTGPSVDFTAYMSLGVRFNLKHRRQPPGDTVARR